MNHLQQQVGRYFYTTGCSVPKKMVAKEFKWQLIGQTVALFCRPQFVRESPAYGRVPRGVQLCLARVDLGELSLPPAATLLKGQKEAVEATKAAKLAGWAEKMSLSGCVIPTRSERSKTALPVSATQSIRGSILAGVALPHACVVLVPGFLSDPRARFLHGWTAFPQFVSVKKGPSQHFAHPYRAERENRCSPPPKLLLRRSDPPQRECRRQNETTMLSLDRGATAAGAIALTGWTAIHL